MSDSKTTIAEQLRNGKSVIVGTKGISMQPLLYERKTHVVVEPVDRPLKKSELPIWFLKDGTYVIHRIIRVDDEFYYTRGDNCIGTETVPKDNVLGIVTQIYRKGKTIEVTDRKYRCYVRIWSIIAPVRIFIYKLRARVRKR